MLRRITRTGKHPGVPTASAIVSSQSLRAPARPHRLKAGHTPSADMWATIATAYGENEAQQRSAHFDELRAEQTHRC